MSYQGDYAEDAIVDFTFHTNGTTGAPTTLSGTPALSVYKANSTTQSTAGITLSADFDTVTGLNHVRIDTSADAFYATGNDYSVVITTGTVGGTSVVGYTVGSFSIENRFKEVDVTQWNGTAVATPTTAGVPEVELARISGFAVTAGAAVTVNAEVGASATAMNNFEDDYDGTGYNKSASTIGTATVAGSVTGNVGGNVAGSVGSVTGNVDGSIGSLGAQAKLDVNAEADTALSDYGANTTTPPTAAAIADAVLDEALSGHVTAGTLGKAVADIETDTNELQTDNVPGLIAALNDPTAATIADAVWDEALSGHVGAGSAGKALADVEADTNELQTDDIPGAIAALNDPTAAAIADAVWDEAKAGHVSAGSFGEEVQAHALTSELPSEPPTAGAIADAVWDEAIAGHAGAGSTGEALTNANAPTAGAIADAVWDEAISGHAGAGSTGAALSNASAPTAAAVADAVWTEAIADHSGTGGSTAEALAAAGGSSGLREIKGSATYNSATKELRVLAWLELSAVVQDATAATLSFKNDAGTEVIGDGSFTKVENADNTWLWTITDGSAINAVKNYMATITFTVGGTDYTRTMALAGQGA